MAFNCWGLHAILGSAKLGYHGSRCVRLYLLTNYYIGLAVVTLMPIVSVILLLYMLNFGRHHFVEQLDDHERRCIYCHEPCYEFLTLDEVFELRERNRRKGTAEAAGGEENLLPAMFMCENCGTKYPHEATGIEWKTTVKVEMLCVQLLFPGARQVERQTRANYEEKEEGQRTTPY